MSDNEKYESQMPERIRLAVEAGDAAEVEKLVSSDWCVQWTAKRAKVLMEDLLDGNTLTPKQALHHAALFALETANHLAVGRAECDALRKRIEELEARPTVKYCGVWSPDEQYVEGNLATHRGSVWHCNRATRAVPGDGSGDWVLCVKRGKDAR
jgi:hypothetical protein